MKMDPEVFSGPIDNLFIWKTVLHLLRYAEEPVATVCSALCCVDLAPPTFFASVTHPFIGNRSPASQRQLS